jgi:hypothetical protein
MFVHELSVNGKYFCAVQSAMLFLPATLATLAGTPGQDPEKLSHASTPELVLAPGLSPFNIQTNV